MIVVRLANPNRKTIIEAIKLFVENIEPAIVADALIILEDREYRIRR